MIYHDLLDAGALQRYAAALNSRAARLGAKGNLSVESLRDRILESGGRCEWCGDSLIKSAFELDHVVSLRAGGSNAAANVVVSCPDCNRRKGRKHPARFAAEIYRATGVETVLISRLVARYGLQAARQKALIGDEPRALSPAMVDGIGAREVPPYRWKD